MSFQTWFLFVVTDAVLSITPGPAVLFVLSQGVRWGARKSIWANLGILSANAMYFTLSATSLGALIIASYDLFFAIKWAGAAYLVYLGLKCFASKSAVMTISEKKTLHASNLQVWRDGFLLQGANPKALLFFAAILPQFIEPRYSIPFQILILGCTSVIVEFLVLLAYGQLGGQALAFAKNPRFEKISNRIAGGLLIGAGLGLARLRRT